MQRFGLVTRVAMTVLVILGLTQLLIAGFYYRARSQATEAGFRLPLPDQAAAAIALLDRGDAAERALVLRAMNGAGLSARIVPAPPSSGDQERPMPAVEAAIRRYLDDTEGGAREIQVRVRPRFETALARFPRLREMLGRQVRVVAALRSGGYLQLEASGDLVTRILGLPVGFFAGLVGFAVAGLSLLILAREVRPLSRLARSVESFGAAGAPQVVPESGAREVRLLIRALNRMQARIAGLLQGRNFMLGALSHDLRTYITRLRLRIELIPDQEVRARASRDIEDMEALVEDSLAFARASFAGERDRAIDLVALLRRECEEAVAAGKPVSAELPAGPVAVAASALALGRVCANLIDNAVKYGGEALVAVREEDGIAVLSVADRGPGIPAADRERIFEPFQRLEASRNREQGGSGLGLAIAHQVIEACGGTIDVADRPGGGAIVNVRLPRARGTAG